VVVAAAAAALVLAAPPPPAIAAAAASDNGAFAAPDASTPATTTTPAFTGRVKVGGCINSIDLAVGPLDGQPGPNGRTTIAGNGKGTQDFAWPDAGRPVFLANGRYKATAVTSYRTNGPLGCVGMQDTFVTLEQPFSVAVPPAAPSSVRAATGNSGRQVAVTWTANTEPDIVGYAVYRAVPGGTACPNSAPDGAKVVAVPQPPYADTFADADAGGAYCYWVQAVRRGATHDQALASVHSAPAPVTVAPSPFATTPTTAATAAPTGGASAAESSRETPAPAAPPLPAGGATDSRDFTALLNKAQRATAAPRSGAEADTGFKQRLPFQAPPDGGSGTDPAAVAPPADTVGIHEAGSGHDLGRLATFAGGLVVLVIVGQLLLLRREVNRGLGTRSSGPAWLRSTRA
jgi:hypothetical protein